MKPTPALLEELETLFSRCSIRPEWESRVATVCKAIIANLRRYEAAGRFTATSGEWGVPWWWVGAVHNLEASFNWSTHLHNGDPLTARTKRVPAGRPASGNPPYTWEASAHDALRLKKLHLISEQERTLGRALYEWERYNGFGYRLYHKDVLSPYLWSGSNLYSQGKYVADGKWNASATSSQVGAAVVLRMLVAMGEVCLWH